MDTEPGPFYGRIRIWFILEGRIRVNATQIRHPALLRVDLITLKLGWIRIRFFLDGRIRCFPKGRIRGSVFAITNERLDSP